MACNPAQGNTTDLVFSEETLFDETPATGPGPTMTRIPYSSEGIGFNKEVVTSQTIRADRAVDDIIQVGGSAAGPVAFELRADAYNAFLESILGGTPVVVTINAAVDISIDNVTRAFNSVTTDFVAAGIVPGMNFAISGSASTANVGIFRADTVTTNQIIVPDTTLVTEAAGAAMEIRGRMTRIGNTKRSFLIEKGFTDISRFYANTGLRVSQIDLQFQARQIVTGTITFAGAKTLAITNATIAGTINNAVSTPVIDSSVNVATLLRGDTPLAACVNSLSLTLNGNTREITCISSREPCNINYGTLEVSGQIEIYMDDVDGQILLQTLLDHTTTSLRIPIVDNAGQAMAFTIPNLYITEGIPAVTGINTDVLVPLSFSGVISTATATPFQLDLPALAA